MQELRKQVAEFRDRQPQLKDDELFVVWFLRAYVTEDEGQALAALCGGSRDKSVDAVLIDESAKVVFVLQGKYRKEVALKNESRSDVIAFADLALALCGDHEAFAALSPGLSPEVRSHLQQARDRVLKRGYRMQMYYVTMGKCSRALQDEAARVVRRANKDVALQVVDGPQVLRILGDYLDGVAPPVPSLDIEIQGTGGGELLRRYDSRSGIESWVFSITEQAVAELFSRAGIRLFARNVRGFLGSTQINRGMEETLEREPEYFWYYNNGITIVCDDATRESSRGRDILRATNPQIINGQQTTRTLASRSGRASVASVLVRVIRVPRDGQDSSDQFETLVSKIVSATNWQNAIRASDLMSNDRRQIEIERQLRKFGWWYIRKRQTKSEVRRSAGTRRYAMVRKDELAQAVAGCDLDPSIVREGKERLFEERWYSQIFGNADPYYYLPRYFLFRQVSYCARGHRNRAYPKWLVLNVMWGYLAPLVRARASAEAFRGQWESSGSLLTTLNRAIDLMFDAVVRFFRQQRGDNAEQLEFGAISQRRGLDKEFLRFWNQRASRNSRLAFDRAWHRFAKLLSQQAAN